MADNEERNTEGEVSGGECPDSPNGRCIKGYPEGWRPSKECRFCAGENEKPWPPED